MSIVSGLNFLLRSAHRMAHQRHEKEYQEHDEQNLGHTGGRKRNPSESQDGRYQRNDEERRSPVKQWIDPLFSSF
jgi:hypothetical protein